MYCRECGQKVSDEARTCPHCGIDWPVLTDDTVARQQAEVTRTGAQERLAEQEFNPGIAALLSLIIPGAGQMYRGKVGAGLGWFVAVLVGYMMLLIPGLILHLICIINAASRG
jgi:hypothetical protein